MKKSLLYLLVIAIILLALPPVQCRAQVRLLEGETPSPPKEEKLIPRPSASSSEGETQTKPGPTTT